MGWIYPRRGAHVCLEGSKATTRRKLSALRPLPRNERKCHSARCLKKRSQPLNQRRMFQHSLLPQRTRLIARLSITTGLAFLILCHLDALGQSSGVACVPARYQVTELPLHPAAVNNALEVAGTSMNHR